MPAHQQHKDNWHTPVVYQTSTGVNRSQCTQTLSVQAATQKPTQLPKSQPRYPKANPGCSKSDQMSSTYQGRSSVQTQVQVGNQVCTTQEDPTQVHSGPRLHPAQRPTQTLKGKKKLPWIKEPDSFMNWLSQLGQTILQPTQTSQKPTQMSYSIFSLYFEYDTLHRGLIAEVA